MWMGDPPPPCSETVFAAGGRSSNASYPSFVSFMDQCRGGTVILLPKRSALFVLRSVEKGRVT